MTLLDEEGPPSVSVNISVVLRAVIWNAELFVAITVVTVVVTVVGSSGDEEAEPLFDDDGEEEAETEPVDDVAVGELMIVISVKVVVKSVSWVAPEFVAIIVVIVSVLVIGYSTDVEVVKEFAD